MSPANALPARRSHAERSAATQAKVLNAAAEIVRTKSFQAATMFEVAKAAGVTPGAVQHHFGSKAELMMQILEQALSDEGAAGPAWPNADGPLPQRASHFVQALWTNLYEPPRFLVAWGIYFGTAGDRATLARVAALRARPRAMLHKRFTETFPELIGTPGLAAFIDLVLASLRGLGVARLFGPTSETETAQLRELAAIVEQRCRQHTAALKRKPSPTKRSTRGRTPQ